ncbi:kinesin-like protein KIN-14Q [Typha angustifolia]|uniref:kinesin-like protein KIN-14Q n=1 Tax=Typha angustifolia TaxID=59011 RepID=UPI003C2D3231
MASEGFISISVASMVEDVLKQHGTRLSDIDLASRKAEEAAARRYEAAGWLRKMVGVVGARDLPEAPSEEEFRLGLRNGIVLCNALNKVQLGAVPKVVAAPVDSALPPDGAALSAYQYFENLRNFLVALEDLGLPTFEASDLEKGGKGVRVVNCVLALKSYSEAKQLGRQGSWKYGGIMKPANTGKYFVRKNLDPFMGSLFRTQSGDKFTDGLSVEQNLSVDLSIESTEMTTSHSINMLVRTILSDKKPEEVPVLVESMLSKVMQEFEHRIASQNELAKTTPKDLNDVKPSFRLHSSKDLSPIPDDMKMEQGKKYSMPVDKEDLHMILNDEEIAKDKLRRKQINFEQQQREIKELKHALHTTKSGMEHMQMQCSEGFTNLGKHLQILANAASGYHKVLEENRRLYNQVQDLKGNIRVYCRVRPFLPGEQNSASTVGRIDEGNITILTPPKYGKEGRKSFSFNKVFGPSATQEEVFSDTQPLIRSVLDGYNVCIFAYGQTGSGKTYTMSGPEELTEQSVGVNYRALDDLFFLSAQRKDTFSYEISVQMIEIYNEQVRDLLANDGINRRLEIRNSSHKGLAVPNASLVPVTSTSEVIEVMNMGHKNRAVGATAMNDRSSRSHSCLTVHVQGRELTSGTILRGCMHLVDLAGSERVDKSEAKGERLKEAQHINKSLSALGDVISSLAQKNSHVPYRNSKLTQLLQDSLGGQAKTLMFVHISPEIDAIGETISTLKFAERVATVELGTARSNKETGEVKELREQIANLKAALARRETEFEHIPSTTSSPDIYRTRSGVFTPPSLLRQPMEDVGNIAVRSNSIQTQKKRNFDLDKLLSSDTLWPDRSPGLQDADDKELQAGDWVDNVVMDKLEASSNGGSFSSQWGGDSVQLPNFFYQGYVPDVRVYQDPQRNGTESIATDDSDDFEFATSDSSEQDMLWQYNVPKATGAVNGVGSKIKTPQAKLKKDSHIRTGDLSYVPSPSQKQSNGMSGQKLNRTGRQPTSSGISGKRNVNGRTGSAK